MATTSSVLLIGHPHPERFDFGASSVADFKAAKEFINKKAPSVAVFSSTKAKEFADFIEFLKKKAPATQWIIAGTDIKPNQLMDLLNDGAVFDLVDDFSDPALPDKVTKAVEYAGEIQQHEQLAAMVTGQSQQLIRLTEDLEDRIEKRHKALRKSKRTLDTTKNRLEAFHRALLGVHRATTVLQMEQALNESLGSYLPGLTVHIRFAHQSSLKDAPGRTTLSIDIPFQSDTPPGQVLFTTDKARQFSTAENDFLHELTEALALALSRLNALTSAATMKTQWQATFDSIPHPLCLYTGQFEIVKLNLAFQQACPEFGFRDLIGKNCLKIFFGKEFKDPPTLPFRATRTGPNGIAHYEITGDVLGLAHDGHTVRLLMLREVTDEVRIERRILEASKLAELGTIGSSIAHELNNPLGGMLSFLQLILMDLKDETPLKADVKRMESATLKCRDIVQNLLSFARKQDLGHFTELYVKDVAEKAVKLIELQSKAKGIAIETDFQAKALISGSENALSQAFCNLLQNSIDAIQEKLDQDPLYPGRIRLTTVEDSNRVLLKIFDNGPGIRPEVETRIFNPLFTTRDPGQYSGMGLTSAYAIISEHGGSLEILSQTGSGTTAIVALPTSRKSNF